MSEIVVLVPGIMGSELRDGEQLIWPGTPLELLFSYKKMASLLKPGLVASDVIRSVSVVRIYAELISSLKSCGFDEPAGTLVVFPYDWRKDNALAAAGLANCLDKIAARSPEATITLLAHSMGGLVSRNYLESGTYCERPGWSKVSNLITMGTPHRGAPMALAAALGQEKRLFLNAAQVAKLANDPQFPSLYQLLPPKDEPFAWNREVTARYAPTDIYDSKIAASLGLSAANLQSAVDFHATLNLARRPSGVRYFFFAGTRQETTHAMHIDHDGVGHVARKVDRNDAGDGAVPFWSACITGVQGEPVGGEHGELFKDAGLKTILGALLGRPGVLAAPGPVPELSVRHKVVEPKQELNTTIDYPAGTTVFSGHLKWRRKVDGTGTEVADAAWFDADALQYHGPSIDHLTVKLAAPNYLGVYELALFRSGEAAPLASTEVFVQEP